MSDKKHAKKDEKEEHEKDDDFAAVEKKDKKEKKKDVKESAEAKAKVETVIDEDTDSEEEGDVKVTRVGYVEMKAAKSWKAVYCVLIGGSMYWSKSSTVRISSGLAFEFP